MRNSKKTWYHCVSILLILANTTFGNFSPSALHVSHTSTFTVAVKAASQTFSTTRELTQALGVFAARSELRAKQREPDILFPQQITSDHVSAVGAKSSVLAAFKKFLISQGHSVRVPRWFSLTYARIEQIMKRGVTNEEDEKILRGAIRKLSENNDQYAGVVDPFLVSLRAANIRVFPGRFITILNVGINDKNIQAVAKKLESEELAWELYAKLIRDFAIAGEEIGEDEFDALIKTKRTFQSRLSSLRDAVQRSKQIYSRVYRQEFPQDPYAQLSLGILLIASAHRHGIQGPTAYNSIMVQRMVFGNRENSLSGNVFSRDPVTGEKKLEGAIGFGVQGDDLLDAKGFDEFRREHPDLVRELELIGRYAEKFLKDIGSIEFTVEHGHFYLLQLRPATKSPLAMVQAYFDMVQEGILSKTEALKMLEGVDLERLKYEPISEQAMPDDAIFLGQGRQVGVPGVWAGVAAVTQEQVIAFRKKGKSVIYVRPVITANDERGIQHSAAVIASRELGNHAQSIALRYGVGAVVDVGTDLELHGEKLEVDARGDHAWLTGPDGQRQKIIPGETILMVNGSGKIYIRNSSEEKLDQEKLSRRRTYLPRALVEVLRWEIEARGKQADFIVDAYGHGERVAWGDIGRNVRVDVEDFDIMKDIIRPHNNTAVLVGVRDVVESDHVLEMPSTPIILEKRKIPTTFVDSVVEGFIATESTETFTYELWRRYDNLERLCARSEGLDEWNFSSKVEYSNAEEARIYYINQVARKAPQKFIEAVVHGVDRHKMTAFIFRSSIMKHFDRGFAEQFLVNVIHYASENGYTGDIRGHDWQLARLFSTVVKGQPELGAAIIGRLNAEGIKALVRELKIFYIDSGMNTKTGDSDFSSSSEIAQILEASSAQIIKSNLKYHAELGVNEFRDLINLFRQAPGRSELRKLNREVELGVGLESFRALPAELLASVLAVIRQTGSAHDASNVELSPHHSALHAFVMTNKLVFDDAAILFIGPLVQSLGGSWIVIAPTQSEISLVDEVNRIYGTQIVAAPDYRTAQHALKRFGISDATIAASAADSLSLLAQYGFKIEVWNKNKLDLLFSLYQVTKDLLRQFQERMAILIAA